MLANRKEALVAEDDNKYGNNMNDTGMSDEDMDMDRDIETGFSEENDTL